VTSLTPFR